MHINVGSRNRIGYGRYIIYEKMNAVNLFVLVNVVGGGGD